MTTLTVQLWNESLQSYVYHWNANNIYDAEGHRIEYNTRDWGGAKWKNNMQSRMNYDENGNVSENIVSLWDDYQTNDWRLVAKDLYECDTHGHIITNVNYSMDWESGLWILQGMWEYEYSINELMTQQILYSWNESSNNWDNQWRFTYTYDESNRIIEEHEFNWISEINSWENKKMSVYQYETANFSEDRIDYTWDNVDNQWVNRNRNTFVKDTDDQVTVFIDYLWNTESMVWQNEKMEENVYDEYGNLLVHTYSECDNLSNGWSMHWINEYIYSIHEITGITPFIDDENIVLYPNPAGNTLFFNSVINKAIVRIFGPLGKQVLVVETNTDRIDISNLNNGIYILKMDNRTIGKFLKQ